MRRPFLLPLVLAAGLALSLLLPARPLPAQGPKEAQPPRMDTAELERTIQLLENPEEAKKLAARLKELVEARKLAAPREAEAPPADEDFLGVFERLEFLEKQVFAALEKFLSFWKALPLYYERGKEFFSREDNLRKAVSWGLEILAVFAAGLIIWFILHRFTRRRERKLQWRPPLTLPQKTGQLFLATLLRFYPWAAMALVVYLLFLLFPPARAAQPFLLKGLLAFLLYMGLKHFFAFLLSAEVRIEGIVPWSPETSGYLYIWLRRIFLFSLWAYFFTLGASFFHQARVQAAVAVLYQAGLVTLAVIILAQLREGIQERLRLEVSPQDSRGTTLLKKTANFLSGRIYLGALLYGALLILLFVSPLSRHYPYVLRSSAKSALVVLVAAGLWLLWSFFFRRLFGVSQTVQESYPALAERVNRFVNYLGKGGYAAILVIAFLTILDFWGVQVYALLGLYQEYLKHLLRIPFIVLFAFLLIEVLYFLINRFAKQAQARMTAAATVAPVEVEKRVSTLAGVFKKAVAVIVGVLAGVMILSELGFDIKPILAGAGIVGLAVGFGAQNLVRDILSGLFYIFENRLRVGDVAVLNGTGGLVEQVNLRTTVLRGLDGTVHVFPNGAINTLSNMTYEFSFYVFDVGVAYKEDVDRVIATLKEVGDRIMEEEGFREAILAPLEILGVDKFSDSSIVIKARIKTLPIKQWFVGREMNRRIKKRFDELGIEIPFPHMSFYFGEASKPLSVKLEGDPQRREEMKNLVREVLKESRSGG